MKKYIPLMLIMYSCVSPFEPAIEGYKDLIVVEGLVTNSSGPHYIKLSKSTGIRDSVFIPMTGARIRVEDEDEKIEFFTEIAPGHYQAPSGFRGVVGIAYKCVIEINDQTYESTLQQLNAPVPIDSIFFELEDVQGSSKQFINFFIDNKNLDRSTTPYFRWDYNEDWLYTSPYTRYFDLDKNTGEFTRLYTDHVCYQKDEGSEILLFNLQTNSSKRILKQEISSISNSSQKIRLQYLLSINQYSLTEDAYSFYKALRQSNQNLGSLFDPQPGTLPTNVYNVKDPNEPIIGFFEVSGVSNKRRLIAPGIVKGLVLSQPVNNFPCEIEEYYLAEFRTYDQFFQTVLNSLNERVVFYEYIEEEFTGAVIGMQTIKLVCVDCEQWGPGSKEKPSYWP